MKTRLGLVFKIILYAFLAITILILSAVILTIIGFEKQNNVTTYFESNESTVVIPFEYTSQGHLRINVELGGSGMHAPFILDTGASSFIIDDLTNVNKSFEWIMPSLDSNHYPSLLKTYSINKIAIGNNLIFEDGNFKSIERFTNECDRDLKGIIGVNLMKEYKWKINFETKRIKISTDMNEFKFQNRIDTFHLVKNLKSHHLKIKSQVSGRVDSVSRLLLVDTGYNNFITMSSFQNMDKIFTDSIQFVGLKTRGLKSFSESEKSYLASSFNLGNKNYKNVNIDVSESTIDAVGLDFFKQFKSISFDWDNSIMVIEQSNDSPEEFVDNIFGVNFRFDNGVCYVDAGIKTKTKDLRSLIGKKVISINGVKIDNRETICKLVIMKPNYIDIEFFVNNDSTNLVRIPRERTFQF